MVAFLWLCQTWSPLWKERGKRARGAAVVQVATPERTWCQSKEQLLVNWPSKYQVLEGRPSGLVVLTVYGIGLCFHR